MPGGGKPHPAPASGSRRRSAIVPKQLLIKGIRSFSPDNTHVIEFYKPLTLIVGQNGAGKTVRLRCGSLLARPCTSSTVQRRGKKERSSLICDVAIIMRRPSWSASRWRQQGSCRPTPTRARASSLIPRRCLSLPCSSITHPRPPCRGCHCTRQASCRRQSMAQSPGMQCTGCAQIAGETEVKAQIKLRFRTPNDQPIVIIRSFMVSRGH